MKVCYSIFSLVLINASFLCAMDDENENKYTKVSSNLLHKEIYQPDMVSKIVPIKHCADIANIPIRDIRLSVENIPEKQRSLVKKALASSWTFNIAMLPQELYLHIFRLAYNIHKKPDFESNSEGRSGSESQIEETYDCGPHFISVPLVQVNEVYKEWHESPIYFKGKKILLHRFLTLSKEEREKIRSITNPFILNKFIEGVDDSVLSEKDYEMVIELIPELEDAGLTRLPSFWQRLRLGCCGDYEICDSQSKFIFCSMLAMFQIPLVFGPFIMRSSPEAGGALCAATGVIDLFFILGLMVRLVPACRDHVVASAQNNHIV